MDPGPISFTLFYRFTITHFVYILALLLPFTTQYAQSFVHSKPVRLTTSSKLGAKFLVVLCAGFTLLVGEDAPALSSTIAWSVTKLASITF
jgi:hypothetical protein